MMSSDCVLLFLRNVLSACIAQVVRDINERQSRELTDAADEAKRLKEQVGSIGSHLNILTCCASSRMRTKRSGSKNRRAAGLFGLEPRCDLPSHHSACHRINA